MFRLNKDLYYYYINMRNNYIKSNYKSITNIDEFLRNEPIEEKYFRFFDEFRFNDSISITLNETRITIPGFTNYIFKNDVLNNGDYLFSHLLRTYYVNYEEYDYDLALQNIDEYRNLKYDLETIIERQDDDDYIVYMIGYYAEKYINEFNICNNNQLVSLYKYQINDYLNYLGLSVMDL